MKAVFRKGGVVVPVWMLGCFLKAQDVPIAYAHEIATGRISGWTLTPLCAFTSPALCGQSGGFSAMVGTALYYGLPELKSVLAGATFSLPGNGAAAVAVFFQGSTLLQFSGVALAYSHTLVPEHLRVGGSIALLHITRGTPYGNEVLPVVNAGISYQEPEKWGMALAGFHILQATERQEPYYRRVPSYLRVAGWHQFLPTWRLLGGWEYSLDFGHTFQVGFQYNLSEFPIWIGAGGSFPPFVIGGGFGVWLRKFHEMVLAVQWHPYLGTSFFLSYRFWRKPENSLHSPEDGKVPGP